MIFLFALFSLLSPGTFLEKLNDPSCPSCTSIPDHTKTETNLMIFMSFSVPIESWKDLSSQLEQTDGRFLLKGLPNGSFEELLEKIYELKTAGVNAPIDIDPEGFEKYGIDRVPAIVLEKGAGFDRIAGNIRLDAALRVFDNQQAKEILERLKGGA